MNPFTEMVQRSTYGSVEFDKTRFAATHDRWNQNIKAYFSDRGDDFLVMNVIEGDGREKLCDFLDRDTPEVAFPHIRPGHGPRSVRDPGHPLRGEFKRIIRGARWRIGETR